MLCHVNEANPTVKQMTAFMVQVHHTAAFIHFQHLSSLLWLTERGISALKRPPPQERWVSVVAEGSQVATLLFTAALYDDVSHSASKRRLCASITVALLRSVSCNYIMSQASAPGGRASRLLPWIAPNVSRRRYGSHNLIHNFCHAAKSPVAQQTDKEP